MIRHPPTKGRHSGWPKDGHMTLHWARTQERIDGHVRLQPIKHLTTNLWSFPKRKALLAGLLCALGFGGCERVATYTPAQRLQLAKRCTDAGMLPDIHDTWAACELVKGPTDDARQQ